MEPQLKQHTILPISCRPYFTKFEHNMSIGVVMSHFGTEFWKISRKGSFFQKNAKIEFFQSLATSGRNNSAIIIDRRKFITKWALYGSVIFALLFGSRLGVSQILEIL